MNRKKQTSKKIPILVGLFVLIMGLIGGGYIFLNNKDKAVLTPEEQTVLKLPAASGVILELPNLDQNGRPKCVPKYDGSEVVDGTASAKFDAEKLKCEPVKVLEIPISGPCPVGADGVIGAPNDWTTGCSHSTEEGGRMYLGHSVRGPRTGAFEHIHELQVGQKVKVEDRVFKVISVSKVPTSQLPTRIVKKNHFSLVTCFMDANADAGGEVTLDTVVELTDKL